MARSGFKINRQGIRKMMNEIQREMDEHPVKARVESDTSAPAASWVAATSSTVP
ncbi:hypothetical protein J7E99_35185 [Streptomyces sp. ISL-44]|uniref:hypothetical protein n=1 Tax=Streptomyces sp. ISL-44 TaxID=2819184 RepID=UPI001BE6D4F9|nr:hypothetical protein [Streptomyces sp. ISL-44]MBT2545783.1 hypothetical protein [Streptomyces sp. ISL-44]